MAIIARRNTSGKALASKGCCDVPMDLTSMSTSTCATIHPTLMEKSETPTAHGMQHSAKAARTEG
jgi:hypothetical protein